MRVLVGNNQEDEKTQKGDEETVGNQLGHEQRHGVNDERQQQ